jgi:hypothetical protein
MYPEQIIAQLRKIERLVERLKVGSWESEV